MSVYSVNGLCSWNYRRSTSTEAFKINYIEGGGSQPDLFMKLVLEIAVVQ